ncbi:hypothetical protein [Salibaculum halophilum]|uniref:hypothetical protein n=1 Tax=Salibaculum halophilum TaxID=1914408 RepID=UPI00117AC57C|nr:hypothetical protein [Salibaculum halophilum]
MRSDPAESFGAWVRHKVEISGGKSHASRLIYLESPMNPAEARNYFSASYFSRDILIPSFFAAPLMLQVFAFYPEVWEMFRAELEKMNIFYFLVCIYFFISISVSATAFLFRAFSIANKSIIRYLIPYIDYQIYYDRCEREISMSFSEVSTMAAAETREIAPNDATLSIREKMNVLLRLSERVFPEGYLMLARLYGFVAVTSALIVSQSIFVAYMATAGFSQDFWIGLGVLLFLFIALVGLVRAAASTELDVLRTALLVMRKNHTSGF